ncbi:MAG: cupin domain-containing protein [Candidatus Nanopelagicaceae bacterium]
MSIEVKNFASADEVKDMPGAHVEAVKVLGQRVIKLTLAPNWKWSTNIKPVVGTPSCQTKHTGIIVEGAIHVVCDDGSEATYSAGDAYAISPGHDAWCLEGKGAVVYEFAGAWGE